MKYEELRDEMNDDDDDEMRNISLIHEFQI